MVAQLPAAVAVAVANLPDSSHLVVAQLPAAVAVAVANLHGSAHPVVAQLPGVAVAVAYLPGTFQPAAASLAAAVQCVVLVGSAKLLVLVLLGLHSAWPSGSW